MERSQLDSAAYRKLIEEFASITALAHGEMFEVTAKSTAKARDLKRSLQGRMSAKPRAEF